LKSKDVPLFYKGVIVAKAPSFHPKKINQYNPGRFFLWQSRISLEQGDIAK